MENLTKDYGLYGLLIYIVVKEIWPFFRDQFFPAKRKFEETIESRTTVELEGISSAMKAMNDGILINGTKIDSLTNTTTEHIRISNDAITAMLVKTGTVPKRNISKKKRIIS